MLPLIGWAVSGDRDAYRYLPESIGRFRSPAELAALLSEVGFADGRDEGAVPVGRRDDGGGVVKLVVAVGGASGSVYAQAAARRAGAAARRPVEVGLVFTQRGQRGLDARDRRGARLPLQAVRPARLPRAVRLGLGGLGRDGGDPLLDRRPGAHRPRHLRRSGRARRRRDAEGAAQAGAGRARDAAVGDPPREHAGGDARGRGRPAGLAVVLFEARDARGAARHRGRARARPARAAQQADAPLGRRPGTQG